MNAVQKTDGYSKRRRAIRNLRNTFLIVDRLKTRSTLLLSVVLMLIFSSCQEKSNGQEVQASGNRAGADSLNKPKVDIKVNRHYDENGNMIGFDSTYSSYYSNMEGDTMGMDTLFRSFDNYFRGNHSSIFKSEFNDLFFRDSIFYPDFFRKDFFLKRYELNDRYLKDMMYRMDSVKNQFYRDHADKKERASDL